MRILRPAPKPLRRSAAVGGGRRSTYWLARNLKYDRVMNFKYLKVALTSTLALNFVTSLPLFALTDKRPINPTSYELLEVQYLHQPLSVVEVACEEGDQLVTGFCFVTNSAEFPNPISRGVIVDSHKTKDKSEWSCKVQILNPRSEVQLTSSVQCKKGDPT